MTGPEIQSRTPDRLRSIASCIPDRPCAWPEAPSHENAFQELASQDPAMIVCYSPISGAKADIAGGPRMGQQPISSTLSARAAGPEWVGEAPEASIGLADV